MTRRKGIHLMMPKVLRDFENDARTQVKFNLMAAWVWFASMLLVVLLFPPTNRDTVVQLLILEVSLWANFATHYGALAAAQASLKSGNIKA